MEQDCVRQSGLMHKVPDQSKQTNPVHFPCVTAADPSPRYQPGDGENAEKLIIAKKILEKQTDRVSGLQKISSSRSRAIGLIKVSTRQVD